MKRLLTFSALAALLISSSPLLSLPVAAEGIGHALFMRGTVVEMAGGVATVCVGRGDGAQPGQMLDVVRISQGGAKAVSYKRTDVGVLRIDRIVDEHFAQASVVSGSPAKNDLVEYRRK